MRGDASPEALESARSLLDPGRLYMLATPDGTPLLVAGAALLESPTVLEAVARALETGDMRRLHAALVRFAESVRRRPGTTLVCPRIGGAPPPLPGDEIADCRCCGAYVWISSINHNLLTARGDRPVCSACAAMPPPTTPDSV